MPFLAVFCGFLAEYQLEDKNREGQGKTYEDLKTDTTRINQLMKYDDEKITPLSTMYACYGTVFNNLKWTSCMGLLILHSGSNRGFVLTDRTLKQLANAGGYRLLSKEDVR